ncbi:GL19465 [Drosophila persimilis]|uniref:GL19465 n=1 Tax=Drosophila persimilis TaxID=7234 RepID=B4G9E0_DROPE|nr:chymotrypsin inhibitor SCI-II [Drosophila persimilis]EDW28970.1 GL19465 [Drosophila persimilis]
MKSFALLLLLCCLMASALAALKSPVCGEEFGKLGNCKSQQNKWTYRKDSNECLQFVYSGCHGNNNLFDSKKVCEQTCKL